MSGFMDSIGLGGSTPEVQVESAGGTLVGAFNFDSSNYAVLVPLFYLLTSMRAFMWTQTHIVERFNHYADKCKLWAKLRLPRAVGHGNMMTPAGAVMQGGVLIALLYLIALVVHYGDIAGFTLVFMVPAGYVMYKNNASRFDWAIVIGWPALSVFAHGSGLFMFKLLPSQQIAIWLSFALVAQPRFFDYLDEKLNGRVDTVDRNGPTKAGRLLHAFVFVALLHLLSSLFVGEALMVEDSN